MSHRLEQLTSGRPLGVDTQAIERELASLWRAASGYGGEIGSVTRACLWNLVVRSENEDDFDRARALAQATVPAVPARLLLLRLESDLVSPAPELEAWVSANCRIAPGGGKLVCSEEITVVARGEGVQHAPALLRALTVPDVPTALLCLGPVEIAALLSLGIDADRLVIDSADRVGGRDIATIATLAELVNTPRATRLSDLGWLRLSPFRLLLASFFDPPVGASPLRRLTRVQMHADEHHGMTLALLWGWLASRLAWGRPKAMGGSGSAQRWTVPKTGGALELVMETSGGRGGCDGIYAIAFETSQKERFAIADSGGGSLRLEATGLPTRVVSASERSDAELLAAALTRGGRDRLFEASLARAVELVP